MQNIKECKEGEHDWVVSKLCTEVKAGKSCPKICKKCGKEDYDLIPSVDKEYIQVKDKFREQHGEG